MLPRVSSSGPNVRPIPATRSPFRHRLLVGVLGGNADLERGEQSEDGPAPASRFAAHDRLVSRRIQLEGNDLRSSGEDFCADGGPDVEHVADAEQRDHCTLTIPRPTITLCFEVTTGRRRTCDPVAQREIRSRTTRPYIRTISSARTRP